MKKNLLTVVAAAAIAVSAQAQQGQLVAADRSYVFSSTTDADGIGDISYQWFRDGVAIPNATGEIYVLPAELAQGKHVEFKRGARSTACPGNIKYSNSFVVTFCKGLVVGSLCWADRNVDDYQTFAVRPDMYTNFFQWNRPMAWPATGGVSGWPGADQSPTWITDPCPAGWRLPTQAEFQELHSGSVPVGGTWRGANISGNAVAGRFFGPSSASCTLPNNMDNCIFLPAVGYRNYSDGALIAQGSYGRYWGGTQYSAIYGYLLGFDSTSSNPNYNDKALGFSIRCVQ